MPELEVMLPQNEHEGSLVGLRAFPRRESVWLRTTLGSEEAQNGSGAKGGSR